MQYKDCIECLSVFYGDLCWPFIKLFKRACPDVGATLYYLFSKRDASGYCLDYYEL